MQTTFSLPFPVSVNKMYATNFKTKRRFPSKEYLAWKAASDVEFMRQRPKPISGPVAVLIELQDFNDNRVRDGDNCVKCVFDFLKRACLVADDNRKIIREHTVRWNPDIEGVRVTIQDLASTVFLPSFADRPFGVPA